MALYQPTNAIPSSYTKGTMDVNEIMEISWQVNGNSAMTAFQIDFYENDYASTFVTTTGKQPVDNFYGTDRFGRPQFFTWSPNGQTWEEWSKYQLTNGNEYKYKITQWYKGENVVVTNTFTTALTGGTKYYFKSGSATISFTAPPNISGLSTLYYSLTNANGWIVKSTGQIISINMIYDESGAIPPNSTQLVGTISKQTLNELFVTQTSSNVFYTMEKPTLTIYRCSTGDYSDQINFPNNSELATSIGYFKAVYEQTQNNPIRWIRWQVASVNNGVVSDILADTGDIYTPTLNFEFNGFFNGQQYAIQAICESESGQQVDTGWILFTINIVSQGEYSGEFTVQCLKKENAALLQWESVEVIPPTVSPEGYSPQISNGSVFLPAKSGDTEYSITWDKQIVYNKETNQNETILMNFEEPWTAVWKGEVNFEGYKNILDNIGNIHDFDFSPDRKLLVCGIRSNPPITERLLVFYYSNDTATLHQTFNVSAYGIKFSQDGNFLICTSPNETKVYSVSQNGLVFKQNLYSNTLQDIKGYRIEFSPNGTMMIIYGRDLNCSKFSINNSKFTYIGEITKNGVNFEWVRGLSFFSNGNKLLIANETNKSGYNFSIFNVNNNSVTFDRDLIVNNQDTFSRDVNFEFSPDGKLLMIIAFEEAPYLREYLYLFSVEQNELQYQNKINSDTTEIMTGGFSSDGYNFIIVYRDFMDFSLDLYEIKNNNINKIKKYDKIFKNIGVSKNIDCKFFDNILYAYYAQSFKRLWGVKNIGEFNSLILNNNIFMLEKRGMAFYLTTNNVDISLPILLSKLNSYNSVVCLIQSNKIYIKFYYDNDIVETKNFNINLPNDSLNSISIYGGETGIKVDSVSVFKGNGDDIIDLYNNPKFEPVWNDPNYNLYMTANFNINLEGGTGTATGTGFRIYRQEVGKNVLTPIATIPSITTSVKDYGIVSRKAYKYSLYVYDNNGAFMNVVDNDTVIANCFQNYSLLVCDYDETNDEYHVRKQYLFALNISAGSVGNNNSPTLNANFTRYPTRMPSTQNYASGTLQGLIGAIYTVPALIEQIGNYKYTAKPSTLDYFDNVDLEKELYDLSTAPYQLFLRDMKGRLRMVSTSGPITMTTNIKQKQQSISISLPWVEIGDTSDVTIIQTPDDYGWNNDKQVLDVSLDVDVKTGELSATYPYPYNGTKFYLTGVNAETLTAKTPLGITPANFNLSDVAEKTNDGELTAMINVNSEDN